MKESVTEFDTLAAARKLEAAGVNRQQAEAHTEALRDSRVGLITQAYLDAALAKLERRILAGGMAIAALLFATMKYL